MIRTIRKWMVFGSLIGGLVMVNSCTKPDANNNNNNTSNNNNNNNNPVNPKLVIYDPTKDLSQLPATTPFIYMVATAATGTTITKITRHDGIAADTALVIDLNKTVDSTLDAYTVPVVPSGTVITLTYTATDSKGNKGTASIKITVGAHASTLTRTTQILGDQTYDYPFLNTGGISTNANPQRYRSGNVGFSGDTSLRHLVDLVCAQTNTQSVMICSPSLGYGSNGTLGLDSIPAFNMNTWTKYQRSVTDIRRAKAGFDVSSCTEQDIINSFNAATGPYYRVQNPFNPTDVYTFKTRDNRYGAFVVATQNFGGGVVQFNIAVQSR